MAKSSAKSVVTVAVKGAKASKPTTTTKEGKGSKADKGKAAKPKPFAGFHNPSVMAPKQTEKSLAKRNVEFTETSHGQVRVKSDNGYNLCALIKWAAGEGYSRKQVIAICEALLGTTPQSSTLGCHSSAGRAIAELGATEHHKGPVAELSKAEVAVATKAAKSGE